MKKIPQFHGITSILPITMHVFKICICIYMYVFYVRTYVVGSSGELDFTTYKDVSMAYTTLLSRFQKKVNDKDFGAIKTACLACVKQKLRKEIIRTHNTDSLFELLAVNDRCCNWMNIRLLEVIAHASENHELVQMVTNYTEVIHKRTMKEILECNPCHPVRTKYYSELKVKFDKDPDSVTVKQFLAICAPYLIEGIVEDMLLGGIENGSLKITLLIPTDEVYNIYLSALMLSQKSRLDRYLQIGDWVVHHPTMVMQSLQKEYR